MPEPTPEELLARFPRRYCPVCDNLVPRGFKPGPGGRPDARCGRCGSLERHRFFVLLLDLMAPALRDIDFLLEVAPAAETAAYLARVPARRHVRLDLGADNRRVDVLGSLTQLPHPDASVDLLVCYHVLEHIPDDASAMQEIARVLAPGGIGLLQVPFRPGTVTDEDPMAPVEERIRRFGQADHVRYYGDDFEDRLRKAGLDFERVTPAATLGRRACTWMKLVPDELVWVVRRADVEYGPSSDGDLRQLVESPALRRTMDRLVGQMVRQQSRVAVLRDERDRLRSQADRRWPRRAVRRLRSTLRRR